MLGHVVFRHLSMHSRYSVFGAMRGDAARLPACAPGAKLFPQVDVTHADSLARLFDEVRPDAVVNCVGLVKQRMLEADVLEALTLNAMFPHRLSRLCSVSGTRLVHISTDCVFSGARGNYAESDVPDPPDLYGRSKHLGEIADGNAVTLRTSIIGHELSGRNGLLEWFLSQQGTVNGFTQAVFSGLPTQELARVIGDVVLPHPTLAGLYQVASQPISKFDLLALIKQSYGKQTQIKPSPALVIDRSLNAARFLAATGYAAPSWPALIDDMRRHH